MRKLLILILPLLVACAGEQPGALRRTAPRRAGMDPVKLSRVDSVIRSIKASMVTPHWSSPLIFSHLQIFIG